MKGVSMPALLGAVVLGLGGYLTGCVRNPAEPSPPPLRPIGTPKDLCCCRILGDAESYLSDALENYEKAVNSGNHESACLYASCAVDDYDRTVRSAHPNHADIAYLGHWKEIEKAECAAAGYLPRARHHP
jgi:hypothetical protein